jgi:hypothetical protein
LPLSMETDLCFIADSNLADSAKTTDQAFNIAKDFRSYRGSGSTYSKCTKRLHGGQEAAALPLPSNLPSPFPSIFPSPLP